MSDQVDNLLLVDRTVGKVQLKVFWHALWLLYHALSLHFATLREADRIPALLLVPHKGGASLRIGVLLFQHGRWVAQV